jgi:hypothetical protein
MIIMRYVKNIHHYLDQQIQTGSESVSRESPGWCQWFRGSNGFRFGRRRRCCSFRQIKSTLIQFWIFFSTGISDTVSPLTFATRNTKYYDNKASPSLSLEHPNLSLQLPTYVSLHSLLTGTYALTNLASVKDF